MSNHYHDPDPQESEITPQVLKAKQVLETLDEMQTSGASPQAQFEFLRKHLPEETELLDSRTPIDVRLERQEEARAEFRRLGEAMTAIAVAWDNTTTLPSETKEIGNRLVQYLDRVRQQAEADVRQHWKSEIEMLSEMWPSAPDVSHFFSSTPVGIPRAPASKLEMKKPVFEETDTPETKTDENFEWQPRQADAAKAKASTPDDRMPGELPRRFPLKKAEPEPSEKVVGSVRSVRSSAALEPKNNEGPNHLRRDAWEGALREMTALPWRFARELHGRTGDKGLLGDVLHFVLGQPTEASARLTIIPVEGKYELSLDLHLDGKSYHRAETFSSDEAEKVHLDPVQFVKRALEK